MNRGKFHDRPLIAQGRSSSLLTEFSIFELLAFEYLKRKLRGMAFDDSQQLLSAILEILRKSIVDILNQVFEE
jgi:hypothetical protein